MNTDRIIGIRLANIFKGLSQINDEVSTLDNLSSEYKEFIPAELNNFKQDFHKLLSGTKLFDLVTKENSALKKSVSSVLGEEIDENQEMIFIFKIVNLKLNKTFSFW